MGEMNFHEKRILKQIAKESGKLRFDNAKQKRVELHMHSKMSVTDGVSSAAVLVKQAFLWGHRAVAITDHGGVQAFPEVMDAVEQIRAGGGDIKPILGMEAYFVDDTPGGEDIMPFRHITLLVKNQIGLKNLYRLVSLSNLFYFDRKPIIPLSELQKHREGLLVGSACERGELFRAIAGGKSQKELAALCGRYDYLEIQPAADELHRAVNEKIVRLADELEKMCVATGDVHYKDREDKIFRDVFLNALGEEISDTERLFFRTTDEMLEEFDYLGAEKAFEIVVANTNAIADMIDADIRLIPRGRFSPPFPNSEAEFSRICWERAREIFGDELPEIVETRLKHELELISKYEFSAFYMTARKLVECSRERGYTAGTLGSVSSMLAAYLSRISDINPLPPHYLCPKCRRAEFVTDGSVCSGSDLPRKSCPECESALARDGQDIPFEAFVGFNGMKLPNIDLEFSREILEDIKQAAREMFGKDRVFTTGTVVGVHPKTARSLVEDYLKDRGVTCDEKETERLINGCTGVKRTSSFYPGGLVIIPEGFDVCDFTPVDRIIDTNGIPPTHFERFVYYDTLPIFDVLGNDTFTLLKRLEERTGVKISDVPVDDPAALRLFSEAETQGIPDFDTERTMQIMVVAQPKTFSDIVKSFGLKQGKNAWEGNARELIKSGVCALSDVIATREDVMLYLLRRGFSRTEAYNITETIRNGAAGNMFDEELRREFEEHDIPEWYFESCKKITYLLPKAHAAERAAAAVKLAWFKAHYPAEFSAVSENLT